MDVTLPVVRGLRALFDYRIFAFAAWIFLAGCDPRHGTSPSLFRPQPRGEPAGRFASRFDGETAENSGRKGIRVAVTPISGLRPSATVAQSGYVVLDTRFNQAVLLPEVSGNDYVHQSERSIALTGVEAPAALAMFGDTMWVLDRSRALVEYTVNAGRPHLVKRVALPHRADVMCAIGGRLFVRGRGPDEKLVHIYNTRGNEVGAMGDAIPAPNDLFRDQLSRGGLLCSIANNTVLLTFDALPDIQAFDTVGQRKWSKQLNSLHPVAAAGGWDPEPYVTRDIKKPWDQVWTLFDVAGDTVILSGITVSTFGGDSLQTEYWQIPMLASSGDVGLKRTVSHFVLAASTKSYLVFSGDRLPELRLHARKLR